MTKPQDAIGIGESCHRVSITGDADLLGGHNHGGSPAIGSVKDLLYEQFGRANVEAHGHYNKNGRHGKWDVSVRVEHLADLRNFVNSKNYLEFGELDSFEFKGRLSVDPKNDDIIDELLSLERTITSQKESYSEIKTENSKLEDELSEKTVLLTESEKAYTRYKRTAELDAAAYERENTELRYALANPEPVVHVEETEDLEKKVTKLEKSGIKSERKRTELRELVVDYFSTVEEYVDAIDDIHSIIYEKFPILDLLVVDKEALRSYSQEELSETLTEYLFEESLTPNQLYVGFVTLKRQLSGVMTDKELNRGLRGGLTMRQFLEDNKDKLWPPKLPDNSTNPAYYNTKKLAQFMIKELGYKPKDAKELRKQIHEHLRKSAILEKEGVDIESEQADLALYGSCVAILDKFKDSIETKAKLDELRNKLPPNDVN